MRLDEDVAEAAERLAVAATITTSSSASPGSAAVMSGHIGPTDRRMS